MLFRSAAVAAALLFTSAPATASAQLLFDRQPPSVSIVSPASGSMVQGAVAVEATASDGLGSGVARVEYQLDGTAGTWSRLSFDLLRWRWRGTLDASAITDGGHTLYVRAVDNAGNFQITWTSLVASNPPIVGGPNDEAPMVSILEPVDGAVVRGAAWLRATASDDFGLVQVEYSVGGIEWNPLGLNQITGAYEVDLAGVPDGVWDIAVRALDGGGKSAMAVVNVMIDRGAPALGVLAPEDDAHLLGGEIHRFRVSASDATLAAVEWQIFLVPADVEVEEAPPPDPAGWEPLDADPISGEYFVDWLAPTVVLEREAFVYFRATDASGRSSMEVRGIAIVPVGQDYEFIGSGGQRLFGTVAIEPLGADGGNVLGLFVRGRFCTAGGAYTLEVHQHGVVHTASFVSDGRGRGEAAVELDTAMTDATSATLVIRGPGF